MTTILALHAHPDDIETLAAGTLAVLARAGHAIRIVTATLSGVPQDLLDASRNLGASSWMTTRRVLIPMIAPGLFAGALLAFLGSLEEFTLTFVVGMPAIQTLPMLLWAYLGGRSSIQTYAAVVSLALLAPTLILLVVAERVLKTEHLAAGFGKA